MDFVKCFSTFCNNTFLQKLTLANRNRLYRINWFNRLSDFFLKRSIKNLGLNLAGVEFALALVANLGTLRNRLRSVASNDDVKTFIDDEFSEVFKSMNLVVRE